MKKVVVIGIGNKLMMDDGIGVYVVEEMKKRNFNKFINYVSGETDTYYCLNQIEDLSYLVIIDAAFHGNKPGATCIIPLEEVLKNTYHPISIHESHLINEIKFTGKCFEGVFICIEPYEINYFFGLSSLLKKQFTNIVYETGKTVENILNSEIKDL